MIAQFGTLEEFKLEGEAMELYKSLRDEFFNRMMLLCEERVRNNGTTLITPKMMKGVLKQVLIDLQDDERLE